MSNSPTVARADDATTVAPRPSVWAIISSWVIVLVAAVLLPLVSPLVGVAVAYALLRGHRRWQVAIVLTSIALPALLWAGTLMG